MVTSHPHFQPGPHASPHLPGHLPSPPASPGGSFQVQRLTQCPLNHESGLLIFQIIFLISDAFRPRSSTLHSLNQYRWLCSMDHIVSRLHLLKYEVPLILQAMGPPQPSLASKDHWNFSLPLDSGSVFHSPPAWQSWGPCLALKRSNKTVLCKLTTSVAQNKSINKFQFLY